MHAARSALVLGASGVAGVVVLLCMLPGSPVPPPASVPAITPGGDRVREPLSAALQPATRELVETPDVAQSEASLATAPSTPVSAPGEAQLHEQFRCWVKVAWDFGLTLPSGLELPAEHHGTLAAAFATYQQRLADVKSALEPLVDGIVARKVAVGAFQEVPRTRHSVTLPGGEPRLVSSLFMAVMPGANGNLLVTVDAADDPTVDAAHRRARLDFYQSLRAQVTALLR